ncbi:MAG: LpqN/LpqT family lipoprotein [Mycobacterium sp.]|nr:LpqN/LpqT family lipoprotein [Mycobacterium sp.]
MRTVTGPTRTVVAAVLAAAVAVSAAGCSGNKPSEEKCETVAAPLTDIPTRTDQEPKLRIPVPEGWERATQMDSEQIRFAIRNQKLAADGFTPNAVVTLQKAPSDIGKPDQVLQAQADQLVKKLNLTDVNSTSTKVCGAPALSSSYKTPEMKLGKKLPPIPARKATSLGVVYRGGDAYYVATVTVQSVKADDQTYAKDSEQILKGFQILPPK